MEIRKDPAREFLITLIGVDGIGIVPFKRLGGGELKDWQREFNGLQQDPCRRRARRGKGEDVADAQPGRRPLPLPD
jgi:hypothetical protein